LAAEAAFVPNTNISATARMYGDFFLFFTRTLTEFTIRLETVLQNAEKMAVREGY
jgi:hypothetical protein